MIAAGVVDTKIVGASSAVNVRPGTCFFTLAKLASSGSDESAGDNFPAGIHGPEASGAASQPPLSSRYQVRVPASKNTSQFVFTATVSDVPVTGAITGSPPKTTRLAGRELTKILGGAFSRATAAGFSVCPRSDINTMSSGTSLGPRPASSAFARASICPACAAVSEGKRADRSWGLVNVTTRLARSVEVAKTTSSVPSAALLLPAGVTLSTIRVLSMRFSGHDTTCGW